MALSLLAQYSSISDLPTFFDPTPAQQQERLNKFDLQSNFFEFNQMEYNDSHLTNAHPYQQQQQQQQQQQLQHHHQQQQQHHGNINRPTNNNNNNNTDSNNNNNNNNNNSNNPQQGPTIIGNINQPLAHPNRSFMNDYHFQHSGVDYEQVINFVDSPPNSKESWTDETPKPSPGPQIIGVQTIYSNSESSRKRRMDWDSLDIGQSETNSTAQNSDAPNKVNLGEKEKKREKLSGRGSWTDDIGFDLNAEFNSNSYLSNEPFMSFSPALTVLKQEPQTEKLKGNKSPLDSQQQAKTPNPNPIGTLSVAKFDKPSNSPQPINDELGNNTQCSIDPKSELNAKLCRCGSPQGLQIGFEQSRNQSTNDKQDPPTNLHSEKCNARNVSDNQALNVISVTNKIEKSPSNDLAGIIPEETTKAAVVQSSDDNKFQYILAAATSIATKSNEETLTYLNQGQSYEIKLKKIGDLTFYRDKILKSVIKICFHERRLQFMEREQMQQWQTSRPGERIIEVDVPLSYGLCHVSQPLSPNSLNAVEVFWDPLKEVGVYIKVNCISTEFTPKKHGGEKGVPFRLQIETHIEAASPGQPLHQTLRPTNQSPTSLVPQNSSGNLTPTLIGNNSGNGKNPVHAAACQIKVFKLKGADRKHKQDREKVQKRPQSEQDKFQPSYECTIMNDIPLDQITPIGCFSPEYMKVWPNSPVHIPKYDGFVPYPGSPPVACSSPIAINNVSSTNSPTHKLMESNIVVAPQPTPGDTEDMSPDSTPTQVTQWLTQHRLTSYLSTFAQFSGSDIMRMSKEDLIQICGLADGIRMFNILRAKAISPRLTIYVSLDGSSFNAIYLVTNTSKELMQKLFKLPGFYDLIANCANGAMDTAGSPSGGGSPYNNWSLHSKYSGSGTNIFGDVNKSLVFLSGPSGVHITVDDEVLNNEIKDGSLYGLEVQNGKIIMKVINKSDN